MTDPIKQAARLLAVEYLVCHTYNMALRLSGASEDMIAAAESAGLNQIGLQRLVERDPAMSDHVSAEYRDAIGDLLRDAKEMRAAATSG